MEKLQLGNSDLQITRLGIGAWAIGGPGWAFAWGPQDDRDSIQAIREGLDFGMNWIDTAAVYGLGHSEEVVAEALEGVPNRPYVFTKCERTWNEERQIVKSLKRESIFRECEASLRRLRIDVIDLYQIHWPEPDEDIEEGWTALADLQRQGKVRWIGVSNFETKQMRRAEKIAKITSLQPPYSMLVRGIEDDILPYCQKNNIGVIAYAPMRSGLLSGKMTRQRVQSLPTDDWRGRNPDFQEPKLTRNLELVELLREIGLKYGRSAGEVAIAWTLRHPAVTGAIVGIRAPGQAEGVAGAASLQLDRSDLLRIADFLELSPAVV